MDCSGPDSRRWVTLEDNVRQEDKRKERVRKKRVRMIVVCQSDERIAQGRPPSELQVQDIERLSERCERDLTLLEKLEGTWAKCGIALKCCQTEAYGKRVVWWT